MKPTYDELGTAMRRDFFAFLVRVFVHLHPGTRFQANWHIALLCWEAMQCFSGQHVRLIINIAPRSLKSVIFSVALPAWILGRQPDARIICASYGQDLAEKLSRDCRSVMESDWYRALFQGARLSANKRSAAEFGTTRHGYRMATSVSGVLTGRGADVLILDDILKPDDALSDPVRRRANEWFSSTLYSRLDDKREGRIIIVQQRVHEDDLVGHVLEQSGENWRHVCLPAIAVTDERHQIGGPWGSSYEYVRPEGEALHPEREPVGVIEQIRRTIGEYHFASQYQQSPTPRGGGIIRRDWLCYYEPDQRPAKFHRIIQSCDTANSSSELSNFTVIVTIGEEAGRYYVLNVLREHLDFPALVATVREQRRIWNPVVVLVEEAASGVQLVQQLRHEGVHWVEGVKPEGDKVIRMHAQSTSFSNGLVWLPERAHWLDDYVHELTTFPYSRHADQVDATSQALAWLHQNAPLPIMVMDDSGLTRPSYWRSMDGF